MLFIFPVCHAVLSVHWSIVVTCLERANLLALSYVMFPMWSPGSGVVLDCIDFLSLPPSLLSMMMVIMRRIT